MFIAAVFVLAIILKQLKGDWLDIFNKFEK